MSASQGDTQAAAGNQPNPWLTLANFISAARLAAAPISLYAVLAGNWQLAAAIFAAAVASDMLDGFVARRRDTVSALGGILDHTADATFVTVTLWAIAYGEVRAGVDVVPGILPLFIALAFLQYLLDSRVLAGRPLRTSRLGRMNGIAYFVVAGTVIIRNAFELPWPPDEAIYWAALLVVVSTLASMFDRLRALTKVSSSTVFVRILLIRLPSRLRALMKVSSSTNRAVSQNAIKEQSE